MVEAAAVGSILTFLIQMLQLLHPVVVVPVEVAPVEEINLITHTLHTLLQLLHPVEVAPVAVAPVEVVQHHLPLIGLPKVKLPQSKTKVNAAPAGPSPPLETSLPEELSTTTLLQLISPSNNSLIAPDLSVTMDAVVELWTPLSHMLKQLHSRPQLTTHTKLNKVPASTIHQKEQDLLLVSPTFNTIVWRPLKLLLIKDQSLLLSMPPQLFSNRTQVELLPLLAAVPHSITVLWL